MEGDAARDVLCESGREGSTAGRRELRLFWLPLVQSKLWWRLFKARESGGIYTSLRQAYQFAQLDHSATNQRAQRARLGLRYFTESILFTFLPASVLQVAWLIVAVVTVRLPGPVGWQGPTATCATST